VPSRRTTLVDCVQYYKDAILQVLRHLQLLPRRQPRRWAVHAHRNGTPMIASSGYVARVDIDLCAGCGFCADICQFAAISVDDDLARLDAGACMGCGVCVAHCPQGAIDLMRDPAKGKPLKIQKLIAEAAVTDPN
jgi:ferredoxin